MMQRAGATCRRAWRVLSLTAAGLAAFHPVAKHPGNWLWMDGTRKLLQRM